MRIPEEFIEYFANRYTTLGEKWFPTFYQYLIYNWHRINDRLKPGQFHIIKTIDKINI